MRQTRRLVCGWKGYHSAADVLKWHQVLRPRDLEVYRDRKSRRPIHNSAERVPRREVADLSHCNGKHPNGKGNDVIETASVRRALQRSSGSTRKLDSHHRW